MSWLCLSNPLLLLSFGGLCCCVCSILRQAVCSFVLVALAWCVLFFLLWLLRTALLSFCSVVGVSGGFLLNVVYCFKRESRDSPMHVEHLAALPCPLVVILAFLVFVVSCCARAHCILRPCKPHFVLDSAAWCFPQFWLNQLLAFRPLLWCLSLSCHHCRSRCCQCKEGSQEGGEPTPGWLIMSFI